MRQRSKQEARTRRKYVISLSVFNLPRQPPPTLLLLPDTHIPSLDLASLMRPISPVMQPRSRKVCGMGWHQGDEGQEASPGRGRAFVCTWSNKDKSVISHFDLFKNQNICPHHVHCGCFKSAKAKFLVLSR